MTIRKLLIANRGEIAVRIAVACRSLGIESVAVYSDADRDAEFTRRADEAWYLGPSEARFSYLDGEKILDVAQRAGADALHPGYGFLAENADFAAACIAAGLTFIGPSPKLIAQMGSKIAAKEAAIAAGVPVLPGFQREGATDADLIQAAAEIGFPVLIKASAGGGGRGMRVVPDPSSLTSELSLARQEAQSAFGSDAVLLEKYLPISRHIEVQIVADKHGAVRHAYERDCSIQRNHQKILEEAPAPNLAPNLREAILSDAVRLASEIGYDSVGTVEFIYDPGTEQHYFLEMNTRLQVEHPVTERVTGLDLAALQIELAAGAEIPFAQADLPCTGWAIEARVAAEDPSEGYRPATGTLTGYQEPVLPGVRIDSGVREGAQVSHFYDSMLAKTIASGPDRATACRLLSTALRAYIIEGLQTNLGFLADVIDVNEFRAGSHNTGTLENTWPNGWVKSEPSDIEIAEAALVKLLSTPPPDLSPWSTLGAWRIAEHAGREGQSTYYLNIGKNVQIVGREENYRVRVGGEEILNAQGACVRNGVLQYEADGRRVNRTARWHGADVLLRGTRGDVTIALHKGEDILLQHGDGDLSGGLTAGMPGQVVEVCVAVGDPVTKGQTLVVLEAMKLLQSLTAPTDGTVEAIHYRSGDSVEGGAVLLSLNS